jgi:hypothetical protein
MKLGFESLLAQQDEVIVSDAELLVAELEQMEAAIELTDIIDAMSAMNTASENISSLLTVIKTHGLTNTVKHLFKDDITALCGDPEITTESLIISVENVLADAGKQFIAFLKRVLDAFKNLFKKKKILANIKKKTVFDLHNEVSKYVLPVWIDGDKLIPVPNGKSTVSSLQKNIDDILSDANDLLSEKLKFTKDYDGIFSSLNGDEFLAVFNLLKDFKEQKLSSDNGGAATWIKNAGNYLKWQTYRFLLTDEVSKKLAELEQKYTAALKDLSNVMTHTDMKMSRTVVLCLIKLVDECLSCNLRLLSMFSIVLKNIKEGKEA